jgi:transcriptional regulator with XRE-family HTH domain
MGKRTEKLVDLLAERMAAKGLGPLELSQVTGFGRSSVWRWMNGKALPQTAQIPGLAKALGVPVERAAAAVKASRVAR